MRVRGGRDAPRIQELTVVCATPTRAAICAWTSSRALSNSLNVMSATFSNSLNGVNKLFAKLANVLDFSAFIYQSIKDAGLSQAKLGGTARPVWRSKVHAWMHADRIFCLLARAFPGVPIVLDCPQKTGSGAPPPQRAPARPDIRPALAGASAASGRAFPVPPIRARAAHGAASRGQLGIGRTGLRVWFRRCAGQRRPPVLAAVSVQGQRADAALDGQVVDRVGGEVAQQGGEAKRAIVPDDIIHGDAVPTNSRRNASQVTQG